MVGLGGALAPAHPRQLSPTASGDAFFYLTARATLSTS